MKKRRSRWGCLFTGLVVVGLLAIGAGAWWWFGPQFAPANFPTTSPVQVFLLTPSSGDEVHAGDSVPVSLQAVAPTAIASAELFVDGQSLGAVTDSPENASWIWQAWPVGIHTFSARATAADGQVGQSQTVIVNVVALSDSMQVPAGGDSTLSQVGEKYGVPPDQMADANPHIDPKKPLKDGQPVDVPIGGGGTPPQPPGGGGGSSGGSIPFSIIWDLKLTKPADKSYCYISTGDGVWDKLPKPPFDFFQSLDNLYTQIFDTLPQQAVGLQAECWGWVGGALQFLGKGVTKFDPQSAPVQLAINGSGFQLTGSPQFQPLKGGGPPTIPPPYAVREPLNAADCTAHGNPILAGFICKTLLNQTIKQYIVIEWEWQPALSFPGSDSISTIDGYDIYEIENVGYPYVTLMKEVKPQANKVTALPLPFGDFCYGVKAFADSPQYGGKITSTMATYCPGKPPQPQEITLTPSDWISTGGDWINVGCPFELPGYGSGSTPDVAVGSYIVDDGDCFEQGDYSGGVEFSLNPLPSGAVLQKAVLKFSSLAMQYSATGKSLGPAPATCVNAVGTSKKDWKGLNTGNHYSHTNLGSSAYFNPFTSIAAWMNPAVNVTTVVNDWWKHPQNNHGFILTPIAPPVPDEGTGQCISGLGNFQLVIDFFIQ